MFNNLTLISTSTLFKIKRQANFQAAKSIRNHFTRVNTKKERKALEPKKLLLWEEGAQNHFINLRLVKWGARQSLVSTDMLGSLCREAMEKEEIVYLIWESKKGGDRVH